MSPREAAPRIAELVENGDINPVSVDGCEEQAYLSADARLPRQIGGASLLSPFDPVVWFRPRAFRLFDFHYRIEIYVPALQRRWGYYGLPFRVGSLLVLAVHEEAHIERGPCLESLARELHALKLWLKLDDVCVTKNSGFSKQLAAAV